MNLKFFLWVAMLLIMAMSSKVSIDNKIVKNEMEDEMQNVTKIEDDYGWNSDFSNEDELIPDCTPDFFNPVSEPCLCIGSKIRIEEKDVGRLYCYPQRNKFKLAINPKKVFQRKNVFPPEEYDENLISDQPLPNCMESRNESVSEVCFCGTEQNKKDLKKDGSLDKSNFVNLKHICVPLEEEDKKNMFSLLVPQYKKSYCYRNQCQRTEYMPTQEYTLGQILMGAIGNLFFDYLTNLEKITVGGTHRHARLEIHRLLSQNGQDISRILHEKHHIAGPIKAFETELNTAKEGIGRINFLGGYSISSFLPQCPKDWPNFEISFGENSEIGRFFPKLGLFEISIRPEEQSLGFSINIGILKNEEDKFMICVNVSKNCFLSPDAIFEPVADNSNLILRFLSKNNILQLHPNVKNKISEKLKYLESKIKDIEKPTNDKEDGKEDKDEPLNIDKLKIDTLFFKFQHKNTSTRLLFISKHLFKFLRAKTNVELI